MKLGSNEKREMKKRKRERNIWSGAKRGKKNVSDSLYLSTRDISESFISKEWEITIVFIIALNILELN